MEFTPKTKKYAFDKNVLHKDYLDFLVQPIGNWIIGTLISTEKLIPKLGGRGGFYTHKKNHISGYKFSSGFINELSLKLQELFPSDPDTFMNFVTSEVERTTEIINLCLQNYATKSQANTLEYLLSQGGSGYAVSFKHDNPHYKDKGVAQLVDRVPEVVSKQAREVLLGNDILNEAWEYCYSKNPNYEMVVSRTTDALAGLYRDTYFPTEEKTNLNDFINKLRHYTIFVFSILTKRDY